MPFLRTLTIIAALCAPPVAAVALAETDKNAGRLTIGTWPGAYADSQRVALFDPFTKQSGIEIGEALHDGQVDTMLRKIGDWDVADLNEEAATQLCESGKLEKLDAAQLADAPDGAKAADDFVEGGLLSCAAANVIWSSVIAYDTGKFEKDRPTRIADLLDTKKFPGKRALPQRPEYTLETVLLADGVAPSDIYKTLETEDGVTRALAALDRIRDDIVWWREAREPLRMLSDKNVAMALAFNGRVFTASVVEKQPLGTIWDGVIYDLDYWAVRKDSPNRDNAMKFVAFATETKRMSEQARWFPYAPARKSASALVGNHAEIDVDMRSFAPVAGDRLKSGLRRNAIWWGKNRERLTAKLDAWRDARTPSAIVAPVVPAKPGDKAEKAAEAPVKEQAENKPDPAAGDSDKKKIEAQASESNDEQNREPAAPAPKEKEAAAAPAAQDAAKNQQPAPDAAVKAEDAKKDGPDAAKANSAGDAAKTPDAATAKTEAGTPPEPVKPAAEQAKPEAEQPKPEAQAAKPAPKPKRRAVRKRVKKKEPSPFPFGAN